MYTYGFTLLGISFILWLVALSKKNKNEIEFTLAFAFVVFVSPMITVAPLVDEVISINQTFVIVVGGFVMYVPARLSKTLLPVLKSKIKLLSPTLTTPAPAPIPTQEELEEQNIQQVQQQVNQLVGNFKELYDKARATKGKIEWMKISSEYAFNKELYRLQKLNLDINNLISDYKDQLTLIQQCIQDYYSQVRTYLLLRNQLKNKYLELNELQAEIARFIVAFKKRNQDIASERRSNQTSNSSDTDPGTQIWAIYSETENNDDFWLEYELLIDLAKVKQDTLYINAS